MTPRLSLEEIVRGDEATSFHHHAPALSQTWSAVALDHVMVTGVVPVAGLYDWQTKFGRDGVGVAVGVRVGVRVGVLVGVFGGLVGVRVGVFGGLVGVDVGPPEPPVPHLNGIE